MMKALLAVRFRALLAGLTAQGRQKKRRSTGFTVFLVIIYIYLIAIIAGVMGMTFFSLANAYHGAGLDWLYFTMAGLMSLALSVFGSVFTTQSQLYDAKDNQMLLAMPVTPKAILMSRMVPLLAMNLLFTGVVMIPAMVVYGIWVEFSAWGLLAQLAAWLSVCLLAQAIACLLGWLLHLLLRRINKSLASMLYMIVFLGVYFVVYSQAGDILQTMTQNGKVIGNALQAWVWPLYAMGRGCLGGLGYLIGFALICAAAFGIVYWLLSVTFLRAATASRSSRRRRKADLNAAAHSPVSAVIRKELRKFLGCPVYLTNMGLGVILTLALPVAGLFFRGTILDVVDQLPFLQPLIPLLICAILAFTVSTAAVSTPSVSLEGKNLWILKSMPIASRDILLGKLGLHLWLTVPVSMLAGSVLSVTFGCGLPDVLLCTLVPGLLAALNGLIGMWAGLLWARFDYISEAYPCKQSISVAVSMFGLMGVAFVLGIVYIPLSVFMSPTVYLCLCAVLLAAAGYGLYRVLLSWGTRKWKSLQA